MFNNLMSGVKSRILSEIEHAFLDHPAFATKVEVHNKFPYTSRLQYGTVLRNTSSNMMRMSADNMMAILRNHVKLVRIGNHPGSSIEWVRENTNELTKPMIEDVSSQVDPTNRLIYTTNSMVIGDGNTSYVQDPLSIIVTVNGLQVLVESVDGKNKEILLVSCPPAGATMKVEYFYRSISDPAIFIIDFISSTQFTVNPYYIIEDEVLFEKTTGLETTVKLAMVDTLTGAELAVDTDRIYLRQRYNKTDIILYRGEDYTVDPVSGIVTFLNPVLANYIMIACYRYYFPDRQLPIYTIDKYQENHTAIPGVVLCIGRRAQAGDKQGVIVSEFQEDQARIYGGHWEMALSVGVISKDPMQMEEMVDQLINWLWGVRKNVLELEGITLTRVEPSGETEESFIDATGDLYYESSVEISVMTEWQKFVPYLFSIRHIISDMIMVPDTRPVTRYPIMGYERT